VSGKNASSGSPGGGQVLSRRGTASVASTAVLLALIAAAGFLYWRIATPQGATADARAIPPPASRVTAPSLVGSVNVSRKVDFRCSLPLIAYSRRVKIGLPTGSVTLDGVQSSDGPAGPGNTYVGGRWLPVPPAWASADGRSYAVAAAAAGNPGQQSVVITNAATGERQEVWRGDAQPTVIGWDAGQLYFMLQPLSAGQSGQSETGLWLVRPGSQGQARRVGPDPTSLAATSPARALFTGDAKLGGGAAWDTTQAVGGSRARVERMDLPTGAISVWYMAAAGLSVFILGFDRGGHPVLDLTGSNRSSSKGLLLLTGANQALEMSPETASGPHFASAYGDAQGVWVAASGSLWLYRSGSLFKVADLPLASVSAESPMAINNASGGSVELPAPRISGPCT
jgi:hypothetical protein